MRRIVTRVAATLLCLAIAGLVLFMTNPAPDVPPLDSAAGATASQPIVVKLHARWCPVCMVTKGVWADVEGAYFGRVRLLVFDFTSTTTAEASRATAERLGLSAIFDAYLGETGTVLVIDGVSKQVRESIHGSRDFADYRAAIDAALAVHTPMTSRVLAR